jgi:hypothetical protein
VKKFLSFLIILLLICNVVFANKAIESLWIGIVRIDGILVPIGIYNKDKWINTWPEPSINGQPEVDNLVKATDGKLHLQDIPGPWKGGIEAIPATVYLWSEEPGPKTLKVLNAEQYSSHCSGGWALKTDLRPTKKVDYSPTPKVGVATTSKSNVIPFKSLSKENKIPSWLIKAIKAKFDEKEKINSHVSLRDREKGLVELSRIYKARHEINGRSLYFIEAQRKYPKPRNAPDADCYNLNSLNSWVILQGNKISFLSSEFVASDCDGNELNTIVPDVVISVQRGHYIVSENYGYEWESYTIHEILDGSMKEVLKVGGGGC